MLWMKTIVYMAMKMAGTVKPRASPDENTAYKPLGSIIPVRGTTVRRSIIIAVRTIGSYSNFYGHLWCGECLSLRSTGGKK